MSRLRADAIAAADRVWLQRSEDQVVAPSAEHVAAVVDAVLAVVEPMVHARWHRLLEDLDGEPPGPIRDHIEQHDARIREPFAEALAKVVDRVLAVLETPDDEQEWEHEDGRSIRRVQVVDVARIRAAINGRSTT